MREIYKLGEAFTDLEFGYIEKAGKILEDFKEKDERKDEMENLAKRMRLDGNEVRIDGGQLQFGVTLVENFEGGIFGLLVKEGKRFVAISERALKENRKEVKGIWNAVLVIRNGEEEIFDGNQMKGVVRDFLEGGNCGLLQVGK